MKKHEPTEPEQMTPSPNLSLSANNRAQPPRRGGNDTEHSHVAMSEQKVLVVGGGLAGLACTMKLAETRREAST